MPNEGNGVYVAASMFGPAENVLGRSLRGVAVRGFDMSFSISGCQGFCTAM